MHVAGQGPASPKLQALPGLSCLGFLPLFWVVREGSGEMEAPRPLLPCTAADVPSNPKRPGSVWAGDQTWWRMVGVCLLGSSCFIFSVCAEKWRVNAPALPSRKVGCFPLLSLKPSRAGAM